MIEADIPCHLYTKPLLRKPCKQADRVRSLCYNERTQEIAVVSLNGYIHCWNALRMKQVGHFITYTHGFGHGCVMWI